MKENMTGLSVNSWIEGTDLLWLVEHREAVSSRESVGGVYQGFQRHFREYVAVVAEERWVGLCSRGQLGYLLGSRFGFSIYHHRPIADHLLPDPLGIRHGTPLMTVLEWAMARSGEAFYDDVALLDDAGRYLGMIPMRSLVAVQSELLCDKARLAEDQQHALEEKNQVLQRTVNDFRATDLNGKRIQRKSNELADLARLGARGGRKWD
jgi:hypothetical protein